MCVRLCVYMCILLLLWAVLYVWHLLRCVADRIHVCPNECVTFTGPLADLNQCPRCHQSRFDSHGRPRRVFLYLPVLQQLRRLFASPDLAEWIRWAGEHKRTPNTVKDITESRGWQEHAVNSGNFNEIRNVALALSTDGFNPFKKSSHSCWPIMLSVLNFPPHLRTRPDLMILAGFIPGPRAPQNINLYLGILTSEIVVYGEPGVYVFDSFKQEDFLLKFFLMQLVADFPAASKVLCMKGSGALHACHQCSVKGTKLFREATTYGDYRRWLPDDHEWRLDTVTFSSVERRQAPREITEKEIRMFAEAAQEARDRFDVKSGSVLDPGNNSAVTGWCSLFDLDCFTSRMHGADMMHVLVRLIFNCLHRS